MESQRLLGAVTLNNSESTCTDEEEWSDGSSYSSYYSDSDSTIPDWEPYVDDFTGELLYIECHPFVVQNNKESKSKTPPEPLARSQLRRSTRGKFLRLLRRRESKRRSKKNQKLVDVNELNTSKVKFQDFQEGEEKEVMLEIDSENRHNLSSDKSLAESLLGLIVSTLSDGNRVMIAGFSYDSKAKQERNIKIGDWLKSINNIEVNVHNLDDILQKFINRDDVLLKLQRVAGIEVTKDPPINELNIESDFVRELLNSKSDIEDSLLEALCKYSAGIVYVDTEKLSETNQNNEDVTYCFPKPIQKNVLCQSRGMFITLNHLLEEMTATKPKVSSMKCNGHSTHVVYTNFNKNLLLFMLPNYRAKKEEIILMNNEIIRHLQFCYETVDKSFSSEQHLSQIDHFFMRFFTRTLSSRPWTTMQEFSLLQNLGLEEGSFQFEEVMTVAQTLCLPDEAQVQIDDALSELEASDYRDWDLLAVLMEAGGCTEPSENNMGPDAFYVEEAQATLAHIQELGLSELCERLLSLDPYPQITKPVPLVNRRKSDFMNINFSKAGSASVKDSLSAPKKSEVTSILKKRSCDQNYVAPSSSSNSLQDDSFDGQSEGSGSQGGYSEISDDSRRNLKRGSKYDSTEEDSDPEDYAEGSQMSTGSYDISEIRQYILSETEDFQPLQLTSGNENVLYHFVQLDIAKGILLCPPESPDPSLTYSFIMDNFKRCSLKMHMLFQNTLRFKNMPAQDMAKSVMNKSLIAIKEHGMLFNCPYLDEKEKKCKITYWVLGRILYMPQPKEVYVCYQDSIPQNMIEIAFKLCSTSLC
nr:protein inturned isoform X2 [Leptinotarsa decemlineata]